MTTPFPFVAAQILTAAQLNAITEIPVSAKTASYTLVATDAGSRITMSSATATTITVNTSLFTAGQSVRIQNLNGGGACTITSGTATVTSAGSLVLPSWGGGLLYFTAAASAVWFPDSTTKLGQVVTTFKSSTFSTASTSYTDVTGLTVDITPIATTSKVLVIAQVNYGFSGDIVNYLRLVRGSTAIDIGDASGSSVLASLSGSNFGGTWLSTLITPGTLVYLDSPASATATTYKIQQQVNTGTGYVNRTGRDNGTTDARTASSITVIEVLA